MRKTKFTTILTSSALVAALFVAPIQQAAAIEGKTSSTGMPVYTSSYSFASDVSTGNGEYSGGIDAAGNTYVANKAGEPGEEQNTILKYSPTGQNIDQIPVPDGYEIQAHSSVNIVIDDDNNIYFAALKYIFEDENVSYMYSVLKINQDGTLLQEYGATPNPATNKRISEIYGMTVDSAGHVYVSDLRSGEEAGHEAVVKFNNDGTYAAVGADIHESLENDEGFYSLDVDAQDNLYVRMGTDAASIVKFSPSGQLLQTIDVNGEGLLPNSSLTHSVDDQGAIYTLNFTEEYAVHLTKTAADGTFVSHIPIQPDGQQAYGTTGTISINSSGQMYVYDGYDMRGFNFQIAQNHATFDATGNNNVETTLTLDEQVNIVRSDARTAEAIGAKPDGDNTYPLGFVSFEADVANGATTTVSITQITDLVPSQVKARKYNAALVQPYSDIPGATISNTTVDGKHALLLTYSITDGGELDQDGEANGTIVDPVGIAQVGDAAAAPGGDSSQPFIPGAPSTGSGSTQSSPVLLIAFIALATTAITLIAKNYSRQRLAPRHTTATRGNATKK